MNKKLYEKIKEVCTYFEYHNKNLTKKQECLIIELEEIFKEVKNNGKKWNGKHKHKNNRKN